MFPPFKPHKVQIPDGTVCDVICMDITKKKLRTDKDNTKRYNKHGTVDLSGVAQYDPNDQDDDDDDENPDFEEVEVIDIDILVMNPNTRKYEWYNHKDVKGVISDKNKSSKIDNRPGI
jgi:hypothetical protein